MPGVTTGGTRRLLLVEESLLFRQVIVSVAREMQLADIQQVSNAEQAKHTMSRIPYDGLILDLDEGEAAMDLMSSLRNGESKCAASIPIAVLLGSCNTELLTQIKGFDVPRILLKPFKIKGVLETIAVLLNDRVSENARSLVRGTSVDQVDVEPAQ